MKKLLLSVAVIFTMSGLQANDRMVEHLSNKLNLTATQKENLKKEQEVFKKKVEEARAQMFQNLNLSKSQKEILANVKAKNEERKLRIEERRKKRLQDDDEDDNDN